MNSNLVQSNAQSYHSVQMKIVYIRIKEPNRNYGANLFVVCDN